MPFPAPSPPAGTSSHLFPDTVVCFLRHAQCTIHLPCGHCDYDRARRRLGAFCGTEGARIKVRTPSTLLSPVWPTQHAQTVPADGLGQRRWSIAAANLSAGCVDMCQIDTEQRGVVRALRLLLGTTAGERVRNCSHLYEGGY